MSERNHREVELLVATSDQVQTDVGIVIKSEVVLRGAPRTIYSPIGLTDFAFAEHIRAIEHAEQLVSNPTLAGNPEAIGAAPEQYIETASHLFIEGLRTRRYNTTIQEHPLAPLVRQKAMRNLYEAAKQA